RVFGADDLNTAELHNRLGLLYYETRQFALAEGQFRRALRIREQRLGKDDPSVGEALNNLAIQVKEQGRYKEAESPLRRALEILEKTTPDGPVVADFLDNLGFLYQLLDRDDEAGRLFERALTIRRRRYGEAHPATAQSLRNLADKFKRAGDLETAREYYEKSLRIFEKTEGRQYRHKVAISLNSLAELYLAGGRSADALPLLERCLKLQRANHRADDPEVPVGLVLSNIALAHAYQADWPQAVAAMDEALRIYNRFVRRNLPAQPEVEQLTF